MNREEAEKLIDLALDRQRDKFECTIGLNREKHEEEHRFLRRLMVIFERLDNLQWGVLGKIIFSLILGAFVVFFLGGGVWLLGKIPK